MNPKQDQLTNNHEVSLTKKGVPLSLVLIVPFVLQIFAAVGIVGYLSFRNGQKAVNDLATQLQAEVSARVTLHLDNYIETAIAINQINADSVKLKLLNLKDYQTAGHYFWKQLQVFKNIGYISYALPTGEYAGGGRYLDDGSTTIEEISAATGWKNYAYATDSQGNRTQIDHQTAYKPLSESWYTETVKAGKPIWTEVYAWEDLPNIVSVPVNYPIYDRDHKLAGVLSVDLLLKGISDFLRSFKVSPAAKVFILERNGLVVASSSNEQPYKMIEKKAQRLNVENSTDPLIKATAKYLTKSFGNFERIEDKQHLVFNLDHEKQFVQVTPWQDKLGLNWLVVVAMPESDFMAEIHANNRATALLCIASLLIAILFGLITSRCITYPIRRLGAASSAIAQGNLTQTVNIWGVNELNVLAESFNQMGSQLKISFAKLDKTNKELEFRVQERTSELTQAKKNAETSQQKAEVSNQAKSIFLANMSHELRTPLNAILGFTQIMQRDQAIARSQFEHLGIISRSGEHLLSLINDVLDMSKIEAGRIELNPHSFDLAHLLDTTHEMLKLKATTKGLHLLIEQHSNLPLHIRTDEKKLRQVLINLLNNAIKFTAEGTVTLRVKANTEAQETIHHLIFEIEDTGIGIAPEELDTLFEPFTQTASGRKSEEGTGLGLSIGRKFVQLMGGDIIVSSQLGKGTIFQFNILAEPSIASELHPERSPETVIGLEPNQPQYRILAVDDRWENRQLLLKLLEPIGFEVREAVNGKEAVEIWEEWQPHLIWMDMRMPIMDGYEATKRIKSHLKGQATFILALTASTLEGEREIVLSAGCDDFVRKPFREQIIFDKMAQYLGVRYIHAAKTEPSTTTYLVSEFSLEPAWLKVMSSEWLTQLEQAAEELDEDLLIKLLEQIPDEHTRLADALKNKVDDFDFDAIIDLVQQAAVA
jgi:signal transduction histidine kinase/CheY-like chemotaxis protein